MRSKNELEDMAEHLAEQMDRCIDMLCNKRLASINRERMICLVEHLQEQYHQVTNQYYNPDVKYHSRTHIFKY